MLIGEESCQAEEGLRMERVDLEKAQMQKKRDSRLMFEKKLWQNKKELVKYYAQF